MSVGKDAPTRAPRKRSSIAAGCLVAARFDDEVRYLIVHPSGPYNRRAPWSIAKGAPDPGETLEACALRETREEAGLVCRIVRSLGSARYTRTPKTIYAYLAEPLQAPAAPVLEPASWEVDRVEFFAQSEARERLHPDQRVFIDRAEGRETSETLETR